MDIGVLELSVMIGTLSTAIAVPIGLIKWCGGYVTSRVDDERKDREAAILQVQRDREASHLAALAKVIELDTRIAQTIGHKTNNNATRLDGLERLRSADIERVVKVETAIGGIEKTIERVEHGQESLAKTIVDGFSQLADKMRGAAN